MSWLFAALLLLASDGEKYVAVFNIGAANGKFQKYQLSSTADGVSLEECELQRERWLAKEAAGYDAAIAELQKQGKFSSYSVTCEKR